MFRGRRAWFSRSVSPGPRELWAAGGGVLAHQHDAEFLFSSDAAHPDTRRIHESQDYLEGRATVFHPRYLHAWASSGATVKASVALGHFILPPTCLQEGQGWGKSIGCNFNLALPWHSQPNGNLLDGLEAVGRSSEEEADTVDLAQSEDETGSRASAQREFPHHALQEYPVNNMVTGYASARDMKKYIGELCDFIPGTSGYAVHWIHSEINLYSDGKTKMKRKL
ncbi:TERB2 protein, partial [Piaya cayana]|nr:TERB2 protein [Piaya cayana]